MSKKNKILVISGIGVFVIAILIILINFFFSNKELILRIPKDSVIVARLDVRLLSEKAEMSKWNELEIFKNIESSNIGNELKVISKIYQNPETSGIDFKKCVYAFFGEASEGYHGVVLALNESKKFEATIKSLDPGIVVQNNNEVNSAMLSLNETVVIWNDDVAMFYSRKCIDPLNYAISIFNQDGAQSMLDDEGFMEFESEDTEMNIYMAASSSNSSLFGNHASQLNKIHGVGILCQFEKNKLTADTRFYKNEGVKDEEIEFFKDQNLSENINLFLSQKKPMGFFALNLDPNNLTQVANLSQMLFGKSVLSNSEITEAFSGETFFSVNDYRKVPKYIQTREIQYREVMKYNGYNSYYGYGGYYNGGGYYNSYHYEKEPYWVTRTYKIMDPVVFFKAALAVKSQDKAQRIIDKLTQNGISICNYSFQNGYLIVSNDNYTNNDNYKDETSNELISNNAACGVFDLNPNHFQNFQNDFSNEIATFAGFFELVDNAKVSLVDNNLKIEFQFSESSDHILWRFMQVLSESNSAP